MSSDGESLHVVKDNLEFVIEQTRASLSFEPTEESCQEVSDLCTVYRQYAAAVLLLDADRQGFFANLRESASLHKRLLTVSQAGDATIRRFARASNTAPFFCALAAGDEVLAGSLVVASDTPFDEDYEFKEDHTYARFLYAYVNSACAIRSEHELLVDELYQDVEETPTARYAICNALVTSDSKLWRQGLVDLIAEHEALFERKGEGLISDPVEFATDQFVMVEGLALIFLGKKAGFSREREYKYIPSLAVV